MTLSSPEENILTNSFPQQYIMSRMIHFDILLKVDTSWLLLDIIRGKAFAVVRN